VSEQYFTVYQPELKRKMVDALERAWVGVEPRPENEGVARAILAHAIIIAVEAGSQSPEAWTRRAALVLRNATRANPELLRSQARSHE
jgi:hypothetical protein